MNIPEGFAHRVEQAQAARDQKTHDTAAKALSQATDAARQVSALAARVKGLEDAQDAVEPVDLSGVECRLDALENAEPPAPSVDLDNLVQRLEALEALHGRPKKNA